MGGKGSQKRGIVSKGIRRCTNGNTFLMSGKMIVFPAFLLHSFKFFLVAGFPVEVIEGQCNDTHAEWNDREMFVGVHAK